jgi:hypothetical protein
LELEEEQEHKKLEEEFDFMFAKHRHGWVARTFRTGPVITEEVLLLAVAYFIGGSGDAD